MATYGDFPGVKVTTQTGGVPSITVGAEEKLVLFGEANYDGSNNVDGDDPSKSATVNDPTQISAPLGADQKFGSGSELADAMKEAIQNGVNISLLYGVAVEPIAETGESQSAQTGTLNNYALNEDRSTITFDDSGTLLTVEFRYSSAPPTPSETDTVYINPLTGEYAADAAPGSSFSVDYEYYDYSSAFAAADNVVDEDETGVYWALSDSDDVSSDLQTKVSTLRNNYQLVNAFSFAQPNDSTVLSDAETTDENGGAEPLYDASTFTKGSVTANYYFKPAPARVDDDPRKTIGGGLAGLYAGSAINDAIYNEIVDGYDSLEQKLNRTEAQDLREEDVIPVRSGASVRVKGNRSTAYSTGEPAADFWTRRIADRVILIGKKVGEQIIGRINDENTRNSARRVIEAEIEELVADRLIKPNRPDEQNWNVTVTEDDTNLNEVDINISFTPYGIVKRVDETITINTR